MKRIFSISIVINFILIICIGYLIKKKFKHFNSKPNSSYNVYNKTKKSIFAILPNDKNEIIFLGNSHTDYCEWQELFGNPNIKNRGINGDLINGIINRLGEIVSSNPQKIFLMIGTNDLEQKKDIGQITKDYGRLISLIKKKTPNTTIYIQSILPTHNNKNRNNNDIMKINRRLKKLSEKYNVTYVNLFDLLKTENNQLDTIYSFDGLHLNGKGYQIWKEAVEKYFEN